MFKFIFEISLLLLLSFLDPKISFFIGNKRGGGEGGGFAEHDITPEGSQEQT